MLVVDAVRQLNETGREHISGGYQLRSQRRTRRGVLVAFVVGSGRSHWSQASQVLVVIIGRHR